MVADRDAQCGRLDRQRRAELLLVAHYPIIVRLLRQHLSVTDADDVAQEVAERLVHEIYAGKEYPVPFPIVVRKVTWWKLEEFRARGRFVPLDDVWEPTAEDPYEPFEQGYDLELLITGLEGKTRAVLSLRYVEGFEIGEIADRLHMTRNAVDQALHRGHAKLRHRVG
jgi:RNA polymerase sigma-70 factor (ECF subfamily)